MSPNEIPMRTNNKNVCLSKFFKSCDSMASVIFFHRLVIQSPAVPLMEYIYIYFFFISVKSFSSMSKCWDSNSLHVNESCCILFSGHCMSRCTCDEQLFLLFKFPHKKKNGIQMTTKNLNDRYYNVLVTTVQLFNLLLKIIFKNKVCLGKSSKMMLCLVI